MRVGLLTVATRISLRLRRERRAEERDRRSRPALRAVESDPFKDETAREMVNRVYDFRRRREDMFGSGFFSDPAWDLLLYLFRAGSEGEATSVSDACDGMAVPQTTGLRWIRQLERAGWVVRQADRADARRSHVRLSARAARMMGDLLRDGSKARRERG